MSRNESSGDLVAMKSVRAKIVAKVSGWLWHSKTARGVRSGHLWAIVCLMVLLTFFYYIDQTPLVHHSPFNSSFLATVHDLHRMLFFIPIIYGALIFRVRGALFTSLVFLCIILPRALLFSSYPDPLTRAVVFVAFALLVSLLLATRLDHLEKEASVNAELRQVIRAQEDERRRVARELHDVTSQALATLAVRVEMLRLTSKENPKETVTLIEEIRQLLATTSKGVNRLTYALRPSLLDDLGLPAAVRSCSHNVLGTADIEAHVEVSGVEGRLPPEVETAVFRIIQEAITNIASHSLAESACISLEFKDRSIAVQVEDDGIGFNLLEVLPSPHEKESMGLLGMKERAELLGGKLSIDTQPGRGTKIVTEIPFDREWEYAQDNHTVDG